MVKHGKDMCFLIKQPDFFTNGLWDGDVPIYPTLCFEVV